MNTSPGTVRSLRLLCRILILSKYLHLLFVPTPGWYEGLVRGPDKPGATFVVEWTPINKDGSIEEGGGVDTSTQKECDVVKARERYKRWCLLRR